MLHVIERNFQVGTYSKVKQAYHWTLFTYNICLKVWVKWNANTGTWWILWSLDSKCYNIILKILWWSGTKATERKGRGLGMFGTALYLRLPLHLFAHVAKTAIHLSNVVWSFYSKLRFIVLNMACYSTYNIILTLIELNI